LILVDTNILAFMMLEGPHTAAARTLQDSDDDWRSESYALIEFTNVLATTMRVRGLSLAKAQATYSVIRDLIEPGLIVVDHTDSLTLAGKYSISAYDARFLVAARELGVKLTTEDARLRKAAPALTQSLAEALAAT
jgi:predicted nucleic acid-binding protein